MNSTRWSVMPHRRSPVVIALVVIGLVALALAWSVPHFIGYVGGGSDDWHYVEAARCVARDLTCPATTHWATRYPVVAPMAAAFASLGVHEGAATIVPLGYAIAALALLVFVVERHWGLRVAAVAGIALVATTAFNRIVLQPNVDIPELTLMLAAAACASIAATSRQQRWAAAAGAFLALAIQTRMSGVVLLPMVIAAAVLVPPLRRFMPAFVAGLAAPLLAEGLAQAMLTGDALHSWRLALGHTGVPSDALSAHVDTSRSPLFNPDFIGGWKPHSGVALHWSIQGVANLLISPAIAPVLLAALALLWLRRRTLSWGSPLVIGLLVGACYTGALIYALAVDPRPRMFLPVAAVAAGIVARCAVDLWDSGERIVPSAVLAMLLATGATAATSRIDTRAAAPLAARWASEVPGMTVNETTRRAMAFEPVVYRLPVDEGSGRALMLAFEPCDRWASTQRIVRSARFGPAKRGYWLCDFSRVPDRGPDPGGAPRP